MLEITGYPAAAGLHADERSALGNTIVQAGPGDARGERHVELLRRAVQRGQMTPGAAPAASGLEMCHGVVQ